MTGHQVLQVPLQAVCLPTQQPLVVNPNPLKLKLGPRGSSTTDFIFVELEFRISDLLSSIDFLFHCQRDTGSSSRPCWCPPHISVSVINYSRGVNSVHSFRSRVFSTPLLAVDSYSQIFVCVSLQTIAQETWEFRPSFDLSLLFQY